MNHQITQAKLEKLPEEQSNKNYTFSELNQIYNNAFTVCGKANYYPYNHIIKDSGWGCAWRAIQTLLSTQQINLQFDDLYLKFSQRNDLMDIIKKSNKYDSLTIEALQNKVWAPAEMSLHWAEPFIASIACLYYNIPYSLLLLNGPVLQGNAPQSVFQSTVTFKQLTNLIKKNIGRSSIMIDDGKFALSIIGIRQHNQELEILFADPHIKSNRMHKEVGVYPKTFNLQGKGIKKQQTQIQESEALYSVCDKLQFDTKNWMICFITI